MLFLEGMGILGDSGSLINAIEEEKDDDDVDVDVDACVVLKSCVVLLFLIISFIGRWKSFIFELLFFLPILTLGVMLEKLSTLLDW